MNDGIGALDLLKNQLASSEEEARRGAVTRLAGYPFDEAKALLYLAMGDESWRVRKEALDVLLGYELNERVQEELIGMLRESDNAGLRNSACEALERLGDKCLTVVSSHAEDLDPDVRKFIVDVLGNIGNPASVPILVSLLDDSDSNVSIAAAENLGKIGDERAVGDLLKALDKNDIQRCYTVLEALGKIGRPVPLDLVIPLSEEPLLKKPVIDCIGAVGDVKAVPLLIDGFRGNARHLRTAAANALMKIRGALPEDRAEELVESHLRQMAGTPFIDELISSLRGGERNLSESIVEILGIIGDNRAALTLLEGCRIDRLRTSCIEAFRQIGLPAVTTLIDHYASVDEEHRCYIIYICGELRVAESTGLIRGSMHEPSHVLRRIAASAAGSIGDASLVPDLAILSEDPELDVRTAAVEALARMARNPDSLPLVKEIAARFASDADAERRRNSAILCSALGDTDKLALLIKDENANVRKAAVYSMAELKSAASVNHLIMALVDEEPEVRMSAAGALGALGGDQAVRALIVAIHDDNQWVKCAALRSLGMLRVADAESAISELAENEEGLVLISAVKALSEINVEKARHMAVALLGHADKEVVKASLEILLHDDGSWIEDACERLVSHESWDIRNLFIRVLADHRGRMALPILRDALRNETDDLVRKQISDIMDDLS